MGAGTELAMGVANGHQDNNCANACTTFAAKVLATATAAATPAEAASTGTKRAGREGATTAGIASAGIGNAPFPTASSITAVAAALLPPLQGVEHFNPLTNLVAHLFGRWSLLLAAIVVIVVATAAGTGGCGVIVCG